MTDASPPDEPASTPPAKPSFPRRVWRIAKWLAKAFCYLVLLYLVVCLIGFVPINNDFRESPDGVSVTLTSNLVHADIIVPIVTEQIDWREHFPADYFKGDTGDATHIAFGWGDKGFYLKTPTWSDLTLATTVQALFVPSASCMHVTVMTERQFATDSRSTTISREQYEQLIAFLQGNFRRDDDGDVIWIDDFAYGKNDAFFEAHGSYNAIYSCNTWAGHGLKHAGIRVGWLTPLPKTVGMWMPE